MRVLYGVCGEGMGHAVRSAVVGAHLELRGHEVVYACSEGRPRDHLQARSRHPVLRVVGPACVYQDNQVAPVQTVIANAVRLGLSPLVNLPALLAAERWRPDVVISDLDPWSAYAAHRLGVPLLAVDNIHFLTRCEHPRDLGRPGDGRAAAVARAAVEMLVRGARRYLVTSFADARVVRDRTSLHRPVLRPEISDSLRGERSFDERFHVVSYFNDKADHASVLRALAATGLPVRAYGRSDLRGEEQRGNVTLCPHDEGSFLSDLRRSRAVVGGAGFTLMSEAICLGKPMLAVPFGGQYEQILNASYLERLGYGARADELTPEAAADFAGRLGVFADNLRGRPPHDDNAELLASVEDAMRDETGRAA